MFGTVASVSRLYIEAAPKCQNLAYSKLFKQCLCQRPSHVTFFSIKQGVRNFSNFRIFSLNRLWSNKKDAFGSSHRIRQILPTRLNTLKFSTENEVAVHVATNPLQINTNIKNNVILYRYEKPYMYKCATAFGVISLVACLAMADSVYKILCKNLFNPNKDLKTRLIAHILPLSAVAVGLIGGPAIMLTVWYIVRRTVKYVILHKGGNEVTVVTYHPLMKDVKRTLPVNAITCISGRDAVKQYVQLSIRDSKFYFVLEKAGHFINPELFDATVGASRKFS